MTEPLTPRQANANNGAPVPDAVAPRPAANAAPLIELVASRPANFVAMTSNVSSQVHQAPAAPGQLDSLVSAGDVICIKGSVEGISRLGATGGFMGHVLLVTEKPRIIQRGTEESIEFLNIFPSGIDRLYIVPTMESCRSQEGYHETEYLLYADEARTIRVLGETNPRQLIKYDAFHPVDLFRSPPQLRALLRPYLVEEVLNVMRSGYQGSWSWSTAVRAYLFSAEMSARAPHKQIGAIMESLEKSWAADPICTSVVIVFWQRYLCAFSEEANRTGTDTGDAIDSAINRIYQFMPLKADRSLPGELMLTMQQHGWHILSEVAPLPEVAAKAEPIHTVVPRLSHVPSNHMFARSMTPTHMVARRKSGIF